MSLSSSPSSSSLPTLDTAHLFLNKGPWSNVSSDAFAYLLQHLTQHGHLNNKLWMIVPSELDIPETIETLEFWLSNQLRILYYPADDVDTLDGISPARTIPQRRLLTLTEWFGPDPCIVVSSVFGFMHNNLSPIDIQQSTITLSVESEYPLQDLPETFQNMGYLVNRELDGPGMFKITGESIHIWGIGETEPVRLNFFDNELEHIHRFVDNKRLSEDHIDILPARELILTDNRLDLVKRKMTQFIRVQKRGRETYRQVIGNLQDGIWFPGAEDYLPYTFTLQHPTHDLDSTDIIVSNPTACIEQVSMWSERIKNRWRLLNPEQRPLIDKSARFTSKTDILQCIAEAWQISTENIGGALFTIETTTAYQTPQHNLEPLIKQLNRWIKLDFRIVFVARNHNRIQRMSSMLMSHSVKHSIVSSIEDVHNGTIGLCQGKIDTGLIDSDAKFVVLCLEHILKMSKQAIRVPTTLKEAVISNIAEIKPGDIVVHKENGIGQFVGIVQQNVQGTLIDCIQIEYANNVFFYMPVDKIESLFRYRSMGARPKLDKLGSPSWAKRFRKVKNSVGAMAEELIKQMASRANHLGHAYAGVPQILNDFSLAFPYQETPDQQQSIDDVLTDLAGPKPMNRLIVGDVGFGKTEVAMRAAIRVVAEGHQVAVLCPTTILAIQHHRTFVERCIDFGLRVGLISRLQTAGTKKKLFKKLQLGEIDILIGTHAIFSKDLRFKRLGLVIVDEEHRFGVKHKEALQRLSQLNPEGPTEYMAMSATPIPRTLHLAMSGLREVSVIATPPPGRISIQTRFLRFNIKEIAKQIRFELQRGGQIFFVHNVVKELVGIAEMLQEHLPNIQIDVASGQHNKKHIEKVMLNIWEGKTHVLVCTTIVENGIDLPNVNTIFINNAHKMGLAQLYQLRGRVGRGKEQGYCTLLIPESGLGKDALSRMTALKQYTALGSGFAIANADLEIRGSGDLLGKEQSGHIDALGLDIYIELLEEAIQELKHTQTISYVPQVSISVPASIPVEYIADMQDRLQSYREMATSKTVDDLERLLDLWESTFGPPPQIALNAVGLAEIRLWAKRIGIERVDWMKSTVRFISHPSCELSWKDVQAITEQSPRLEFVYLQNGLWKFSSKVSYEENQNPIPFVLQLMGLFVPLLPNE